jgi:hypothetical protein
VVSRLLPSLYCNFTNRFADFVGHAKVTGTKIQCSQQNFCY